MNIDNSKTDEIKEARLIYSTVKFLFYLVDVDNFSRPWGVLKSI